MIFASRRLIPLLSVALLFSASACRHYYREIRDNRKPIKLLYFKKRLSLRQACLSTKYLFTKHSFDTSSVKKGWTLTFSDEFDSLDLKKWRPGQPWGEVHPGNLHQYYDPREVQVRNGMLYLGGAHKPKKIMVRDSMITVPYAIGLINSDISFKQKYGYFEIRSRNPSGPATWPAFWLTGANKWPPEIDIFEMYGGKTGKNVHNQYATLHWGKTDTRSMGYLSRKINLPNNTDTVFHIYGCEWTPRHIKFYTDGHLTSSIRVNRRLRQWMDDEMVIIINNCFDAKYLKYLPSDFIRNDFVVDWVRVYSKNP